MKHLVTALLVGFFTYSIVIEGATPKRCWGSYSLRTMFAAVTLVGVAFGYRDIVVQDPIRSADRGTGLLQGKHLISNVAHHSIAPWDIARRDIRDLTASDVFMALKGISIAHPEMVEGTKLPESLEEFAAYYSGAERATISPWDYSLHPVTWFEHYEPIARSRRASLERIFQRYYLHLLAQLEDREVAEESVPLHITLHGYAANLERLNTARDYIAKYSRGDKSYRLGGVYLLDRAIQLPQIQPALLQELPGEILTGQGTASFTRIKNGIVVFNTRDRRIDHRTSRMSAPTGVPLRVVFGLDAEIYENHFEDRLEEIVEKWLLDNNEGSLWKGRGYAPDYKQSVDKFIAHLMKNVS